MRKETILKYEKEFIAWCKGELVLMGSPTSMEDAAKSILTWKQVTSFDDWGALDTKYVLDDSYCIYRKALTEGKTVEVFFPAQYNNGKDEWVDCKNISHFHFSGKVSDYRIKPEEPQFKVGDWVYTQYTYKGKADKILGQVYLEHHTLKVKVLQKFEFDSYRITVDNTTEFWEPKPNEWCIFKERDSSNFIIDKFVTTETFPKEGISAKCDRHWAEFTCAWFHEVYPLEFVQTLKD